jgi:hypothetical protein
MAEVQTQPEKTAETTKIKIKVRKLDKLETTMHTYPGR